MELTSIVDFVDRLDSWGRDLYHRGLSIPSEALVAVGLALSSVRKMYNLGGYLFKRKEKILRKKKERY